ncbi:MAG: ABC transporter ATP-binding protein, partial [Saprospiraceae bacterium]
SGGERARLALACMLLRPFNFLLLDEPTNHLDMLSKEVLKNALMEYNGTLLVVSHDREFLADLTDRTIEFRDHRLIEYLGDVNYFLDKRKANDMREVEKRTKPTGGYAAPDDGVEALGAEEKKALQRTVQKAEKRIGELENDIQTIESQMGADDFYARPESNKVLEKYDTLKSELTKVMAEWEAALEQLG